MSNPPYIATEEVDRLEAGVKDFEPRLALDGGPGGLAMVADLIEEAPSLLKPGGYLLLEIGSAQEKPVQGADRAPTAVAARADRLRSRPAPAGDPRDPQRRAVTILLEGRHLRDP